MEYVNISVVNTSIDSGKARQQALKKADEMLTDPVVVAWRDDRFDSFAPEVPGGSQHRWYDYNEDIAGGLECSVGDAFHFIFTGAADFDVPNLNQAVIDEENGTRILCVNKTCSEEGMRRIGQFAGGGVGGV